MAPGGGFTYVEAYLGRAMDIDDFTSNRSFFFSNGMDPGYSVLDRLARRIWAVTLSDKYGANERSQKLKHRIEPSGRPRHAQEISFNDFFCGASRLLCRCRGPRTG